MAETPKPKPEPKDALGVLERKVIQTQRIAVRLVRKLTTVWNRIASVWSKP